jgi:hypothetical protein
LPKLFHLAWLAITLGRYGAGGRSAAGRAGTLRIEQERAAFVLLFCFLLLPHLELQVPRKDDARA